jgi:hypothetical protein
VENVVNGSSNKKNKIHTKKNLPWSGSFLARVDGDDAGGLQSSSLSTTIGSFSLLLIVPLMIVSD